MSVSELESASQLFDSGVELCVSLSSSTHRSSVSLVSSSSNRSNSSEKLRALLTNTSATHMITSQVWVDIEGCSAK